MHSMYPLFKVDYGRHCNWKNILESYLLSSSRKTLEWLQTSKTNQNHKEMFFIEDKLIMNMD